MNKVKKEEQENQKKRCNECGSTLGYLRIKDNSWVCRSCGHVEVRED